MKILAIRGKNLASLEGEFEIDFTTEPLKAAGIFAITGPTGAGKSTILDALCLALFDDAPRLNKAESSVNVSDIEDKTITQKDSRNILRRGTSEGYAQVDFIALNGDKYSSTWSVRRARGKTDGALQLTTIRLTNLSSGIEEQGTKKDLLNRITEIIGLTFDQFTRAVLLAQGDFATFLKAKQNEKAELLEKLTGTEVYSKISSLIYQRTNEARNDLELLKHRIADIKLLTEEELESLNQEKEKLTADIAPLKQQQITIGKKLEWISQAKQLEKETLKAEQQLKEIQERIREASPRYEYMSMIDISQEIRDTYIDLINKKKQFVNLTEELQGKEKDLIKITVFFEKAETELKAAGKYIEETDRQYNDLKPEIGKAQELDMKTMSLQEKIAGSQKDLQQSGKQVESTAKNIDKLQQQSRQYIQIKKELHKWLEENGTYKEIALSYELVDTLLENARVARDQGMNTRSSLDSSKKLLESYTIRQKQLEKEVEHLNNLLPTEVVNLRKKLEEGKPCPVCGSLQHPLKNNVHKNNETGINEEELEKAKTKLAETILQTKNNIDETVKNITVLETHIQSYRTQYTQIINNLNNYLKNIPEWQTKFNKGTFRKELSEIVTQWNESQNRLLKCEQQIENILLQIEIEQKTLQKQKDELNKKTETCNQEDKTLSELKAQRLSLLKGKSIEETEKHFSQLKRQYTEKYELLRNEREKADKNKAVISGTIVQLKNNLSILTEQISHLEKTVKEWTESGKHPVTFDLLKDLLSKSVEWMKQEKKYLSDINDQQLVLSTTLKDKKERYKKHFETDDKPEEKESQEYLTEHLKEINQQSDLINKRLTEIEISLITHKNSQERIKTIESELKSKEELYTNWAKLNELLGSAKGDKFKTIAQGYTLDVLLEYANKHLEDLTGRYKLEKIPGTLALQVVDNDMLGEVRTVHSLSGGESFLISLSLALGLSGLSSNRMKIESLFIDEGFGALDIDTLNIAMNALDNLQTQGRKIGVISHVEEMKERICVQIQIIKSSNGKSIVKVTG